MIDEQTHDRTSVAYLKAEQKRIAEELKAARDAERAKKSGRVSSDVASVNATKALVARVEKRIKSGTEREEALTAELTLLRRAISALLDAQQTQTTEAK